MKWHCCWILHTFTVLTLMIYYDFNLNGFIRMSYDYYWHCRDRIVFLTPIWWIFNDASSNEQKQKKNPKQNERKTYRIYIIYLLYKQAFGPNIWLLLIKVRSRFIRLFCNVEFTNEKSWIMMTVIRNSACIAKKSQNRNIRHEIDRRRYAWVDYSQMEKSLEFRWHKDYDNINLLLIDGNRNREKFDHKNESNVKPKHRFSLSLSLSPSLFWDVNLWHLFCAKCLLWSIIERGQ